MDISLVVNRLQELGSTASLSYSDKTEIENLYIEVLDKKFRRTSCNDCYRDAVIEMSCYLKKHGKMKEKREFKLKNGILLQMGFGSADFYTNENLTDDIAISYLKKYPQNINYFAHLPENWEELVKNKSLKAVKVNEELTKLIVQSFNDGVSVESVLSEFSNYKLNGRKISKKVLSAHVDLATEIVKKQNK